MSSDTEIRPFRVNMPDEAIADLRRRIAASRRTRGSQSRISIIPAPAPSMIRRHLGASVHSISRATQATLFPWITCVIGGSQ